MSAEPTVFEVDGCTFEVKRLGVDASCEGLEVLAKALGPLMSAEGEINWMTAVLGQATQLPKLLRLFAPATKVSRFKDGRFESGGEQMVPLVAGSASFVNDCFGGRHVRMIGFLVKAVQAEYGGFLAQSAELVALLPSPPTA
jgi:hypothetical protein